MHRLRLGDDSQCHVCCCIDFNLGVLEVAVDACQTDQCKEVTHRASLGVVQRAHERFAFGVESDAALPEVAALGDADVKWEKCVEHGLACSLAAKLQPCAPHDLELVAVRLFTSGGRRAARSVRRDGDNCSEQ